MDINGSKDFSPVPGDEQKMPFSPHVTEKSSGFSAKRIALVIIGLILLGGIGFGAALLTNRNDNANQPAVPDYDQANTPAETNITDVPEVNSTKTFKSDFPRIEFTYPGNWIAIADSEQADVRIESPEFSYTNINGGAVKGNFRIYIRKGARQQDSKYIGRGIAAMPSEKLAYANPPAGQRKETNLSFFGLDTPDNFAYFLIAGNFSLDKGQSLGPDYGKEPETYIIVGGYSSNELDDDLATNIVPLDYFKTTNAFKQAIDILKSLKLL